MTALAPTLEAYFTERLIGQRQASANTVAAYRDAWRLLLGYTQMPVVSTRSCPSQRATTVRSTPQARRFMAQLCRSTCG